VTAIRVIPASAAGSTMGINVIIRLLFDYRPHLIKLFRIKRQDHSITRYTFIVVFREPGSIGQLVAFIHEWGTASGQGEGEENTAETYGFSEIMTTIKQLKIRLLTVDWHTEIHEGWKQKLEVRPDPTVLRYRLADWEGWLLEQIDTPWFPMQHLHEDDLDLRWMEHE